MPGGAGSLRSAEATDENCDFAKGFFTSVMLRRDGHGWHQVPVPNAGRVYQVSASGPEDAWASTDCGLLHWDGSSWASVPYDPIPGAEQSGTGPIKAVGPKDAWLAGSTYDSATEVMRGFVQRWDGRHWRDARLPALGDDFTLDGIDARGPRDVWAVGTDYTSADADREHLLLLHWNGHRWASAKVPDGPGELMDVAVNGGRALAVGDTFSPSESDYTMYVLRRTASGWRTDAAPAGTASLFGLAPVPGGGLWSVGTTGGDQHMRPLIARRK